MKNSENRLNRRNALKTLGLGSTAGVLGLLGSSKAHAANKEVPTPN